MSNALAIASVTRLLKDLLNDGLVNSDISADVGSEIKVSALPPDLARLQTGDGQPQWLNLFLHRITSNPALSTSDLPTRDGRGNLVAAPRLALDLHYLLTAYSTVELHGEILLGYAMEMLHETPVLTRNAIRAALQGTLNGSILPPAFQLNDPARLADQIEMIRITPQPLSLDDMSKIWTAFQTNYRTTVAYQVSVVLIERERAVRRPLPVLSRGPRDGSGRDAGVQVRPDLLPPSPMLAALVPGAGRPAVRLGEALTLLGHHLGDAVRVRFTAPETGAALELPLPVPAEPGRLKVAFPATPAGPAEVGTGADPDAWRVGVYLVEIVLAPSAGGVHERITNRLPLILAPDATPTAVRIGNGADVSVACKPVIRAGQQVSIVAGQAERPISPAVAAGTAAVTARFDPFPVGVDVPVRLRVDGIDSLLIDPAASPPAFDPSQLVKVT